MLGNVVRSWNIALHETSSFREVEVAVGSLGSRLVWYLCGQGEAGRRGILSRRFHSHICLPHWLLDHLSLQSELVQTPLSLIVSELQFGGLRGRFCSNDVIKSSRRASFTGDPETRSRLSKIAKL